MERVGFMVYTTARQQGVLNCLSLQRDTISDWGTACTSVLKSLLCDLQERSVFVISRTACVNGTWPLCPN